MIISNKNLSKNKYSLIPYILFFITLMILISVLNYKKNLSDYSFIDYIASQTKKNIFKNNYKNISIDIKLNDFDNLKKNLDVAYKNGILTEFEKQFFPAKIKIKNKTYKSKIRLKGAFNDHRMSQKKFSIEYLKEKNIDGFNEFSFQHPKTRSWYFEKHFNDLATKLNIFAPYYDYVNLYINGESSGIMALEEVYGKETFVRLNKPESIIIRIDDNKLNEQLVRNYKESDIVLHYPNINNIKSGDESFENFKYASGILENFLNGKLKPSEAFDINSIGKFLAFADIFKAYHGLDATNMFFYYNKYNNKLEPMLYDSDPLLGTGYSSTIYEYNFIKQFFLDPVIFNAYKKNLKILTNIIEKKYLQKLKKNVLKDYYNFVSEFIKIPKYPFNQLEGRISRLKDISNLSIDEFIIFSKYKM